MSNDNYLEVRKMLDCDTNGHLLETAENLFRIFQHDSYFCNIYMDTLSMTPCRVMDNGSRECWRDADDALARMHIEKYYHIRNKSKTDDAFAAFMTVRQFNPITELIKSVKWDGKPHVETLLIRWMKADDTAYTREVSRLDYAQRIARAKHPGCKAEHVPILIGAQGSGKSTFTRFSALRDEFYCSVRTIDAQRGLEAIEGKYVCELEELTALMGEGAKKISEVKAFVSAMSDHYRKPYERRAADYPRTNVFVGTTNSDQFLMDQTGGRRFFPVRCHQDGYWIFEHEAEIKEDIAQAYAEMFTASEQNLPLACPAPNRALLGEIVSQQEQAQLDDYRIGVIEAYLQREGKRFTCIIDLWENALKNRPDTLTRPAANELGELLRHKLKCNQAGTKRFPAYGVQRAFEVPDSVLYKKNED